MNYNAVLPMTIGKLRSLSIFLYCALSFTTTAMDQMVSQELLGDHKYKLDLTKTNSCWYTPCFHPETLPEPVENVLTVERHPWATPDLLVYGGVSLDPNLFLPINAQATDIHDQEIVAFTERQEIQNTKLPLWSPHGLLTLEFNGITHTASGSLISPWHVLTTGRNLYDPEKHLWAENVIFHPGRCGSKLLHQPVKGTKKAIFEKWKWGNKEWDIGIVELEQDVGTQLGWNGLLWGADEDLQKLDPINIVGYSGHKLLGTAWHGISSIQDIHTNQFTYTTLNASEGDNGANVWVTDVQTSLFPVPKGNYSLGVHAYGLAVDKRGIENIATRLTPQKFEAIVRLINDLL